LDAAGSVLTPNGGSRESLGKTDYEVYTAEEAAHFYEQDARVPAGEALLVVTLPWRPVPSRKTDEGVPDGNGEQSSRTHH
jgi:hypothetical protein